MIRFHLLYHLEPLQLAFFLSSYSLTSPLERDTIPEYEDIFAALHNDALPSVTGEDGLAVLKAAIQISSMAYQEDHGVQAAKVAVEAGVEV